MKKCPYCAERIKDEAIVCRYCGRDLPELGGANSIEDAQANAELSVNEPSKGLMAWLNIAAVCSILLIVLHLLFFKTLVTDSAQVHIEYYGRPYDNGYFISQLFSDEDFVAGLEVGLVLSLVGIALCIGSIVGSRVYYKKEKYTVSLFVSFLPLFSIITACILLFFASFANMA